MFVHISTIISFVCERCEKTLSSRNKLRLHERTCKHDALQTISFISSIDKTKKKIDSNKLLIKFEFEIAIELKYVFKNHRYITMNVKWDLYKNDVMKTCFDTRTSINLIDVIFIKKILLECSIHKTNLLISIRDIDDVQKFNEFVLIIMYINNVINDDNKINSSIIVAITRQIHFINDLKIKILVDNDIMTSKKMLLNFDRQKIRIDNCRDLRTSLNIKTRQISSIKKTIRFRFKMTIFLYKTINVSIVIKSFSSNRDFLFELTYQRDLNQTKKVFVYIVDVDMLFVQIYNETRQFIIVNRHFKLRNVIEYD